MTMVIDLPSDLTDLLQEEAERRGQSVSDFVRPALEELVTRGNGYEAPNGAAPLDQSLGTNSDRDATSSVLTEEAPVRAPEVRSIHEVLDEICQSIPESEWSKIPPDFSENLDHYLYGTKKRQ